MIRYVAWMLCCVLLCGCEPPVDAYTKKPPVPIPAPVVEAPPPVPEGPAEMVRVKAKAGVVDPSKYDANIATSPLTASFSLQQQLIFDAAIPKAMSIFEGLRNRKPNSQQEFMQEIIAKNNIRLPPLPPQYRYIYDEVRGELMIEYPRSAD